MRRFWISCLFMIIYVVSFILNLNVADVNTETIIFSLGMGKFEISGVAIIEVTLKMIPFFLFQVLCGSGIYLNICEGGIYYLYRCNNRGRWITEQLLKQLFFCFLYSFLYYIISKIFTYFLFGINPGEMPLLTIWCIITMTLFLYCAVILINFFSFISNSAVGATIVIGLQMFMISLFLFFQKGGVFDIYTESNPKHILLLKFNLMAHCVTSWHKINANDINNVGISLSSTMIMVLILSIFISILFFYIIRKLDIIEEKRS